MNNAGVYVTHKKDGTIYYRSSITFKNKHISLGSFNNSEDAHLAYMEADMILHSSLTLQDYTNTSPLHFEKWVSLINFRDNNIYIKNPIYIYKKFFHYYMDEHTHYTFDVDDLFYYSTHKIMRRGNYLFVSSYGLQTNILSRYGIKNYALPGKDYIFANDDSTDYRYKNIVVINKYNGVFRIEKEGIYLYRSKIHINGNYIIGTYPTEIQAAIAYNKAIDLLKEKNIAKNYTSNYIENISAIEYASIYNKTRISKRIRNLLPQTN